MKLHARRLLVVFAAFLLAPGITYAQRSSSGPTSSTVVVRVQAPDGGPFDTSADVELSSGGEGMAIHEQTRDAGDAEFASVGAGIYSVVVTAPGYKPATTTLEVAGLGGDFQVWIRLEPDSGVATTANKSGGHVLAPKAKKAVAKGIEDLRAGEFQDAQKEFEAAYKLAPGDPDVNYYLGYTFLQENDPNDAQTYLQRTTSIDPKHVSALTALGQLRMQQGNFPAAIATLEQALSLDAENWLVHWTLASTYKKDQQYEKARIEADAAVKFGKGAANGAKIIIGECWAEEGESEKAIEALESFVRDAPGNSSVPAAQTMIAKLKAKKSAEDVRAIVTTSLTMSAAATSGKRTTPTATATEMLPGLSIAESNMTLPDWAPASVDKVKPAVSATATCSLPQVLEKTGNKIEEFVTNVENIDATEELVHENLDELGKASQKQKQRYDYMVNMAKTRPGHITMEEQRNSIKRSASFPDGIASSGLPGIVLVFHPYMRDDYQMTCEGLGDWHGRPAWIVYFRQRDNLPGRISGYSINGVMHAISLKGRAWITADSFQIAHMETDMVKPMPEIQLMLEHISVNYKPVHFQARGEDVWLPANADLYFEFRKHRFHRLDSYSHYRLFSVDSREKIGDPVQNEPGSGGAAIGRSTP